MSLFGDSEDLISGAGFGPTSGDFMPEAGLNGSMDHNFPGSSTLIGGNDPIHGNSSEQWLINNGSGEMALVDSDQNRSGLHLPGLLDNSQAIHIPPTPGGGAYVVLGGPGTPATPMTPGYGAPMTPTPGATPIASPGGVAFMPPVAAPIPPIESPAMLDEIHKNVATQAHQLDALKARQKALIDQMLQTVLSQRAQQLQFEAQQIFGEQQKMGSVIETMLKHLQLFNQNNILSPFDLNRVYMLHSDLCVHLKQLEILNVELRSLFMTDVAPPVPALVIMRQPFPDVIAKNRQLPGDALAVKLVCGAATQLSNLSPVKATIIADSHQGGKGAQEKPLEFDVQHLDPQTYVAQFPIKFAKGSRKCKVALRFNVQATLATRSGPRAVNIESPNSHPFIVITNEAQWEGSEELLLKLDAFNSMLEIPVQQFFNTLQRHFIRATKQDLARPRRPLSLYDFDFVHEKLSNKQKRTINLKEFEGLWSWFGKTLQVMRYQRHINSLWQSGLLYGMMTRKSVEAAIIGHEPGTFIIRFSEQYPGQFGIAYIALGSPQPKHYLVGTNDTAGAKKTLPDFVMEQKPFTHILQLQSDPGDGIIRFMRLQKQQALAQYCAQTHDHAKQDSEDGYEPLC